MHTDTAHQVACALVKLYQTTHSETESKKRDIHPCKSKSEARSEIEKLMDIRGLHTCESGAEARSMLKRLMKIRDVQLCESRAEALTTLKEACFTMIHASPAKKTYDDNETFADSCWSL